MAMVAMTMICCVTLSPRSGLCHTGLGRRKSALSTGASIGARRLTFLLEWYDCYLVRLDRYLLMDLTELLRIDRQVVRAWIHQQAAPCVIQLIHVSNEAVVQVDGAGVSGGHGNEGIRFSAAEPQPAKRPFRFRQLLHCVVDLRRLVRFYGHLRGVFLVTRLFESDFHISGRHGVFLG